MAMSVIAVVAAASAALLTVYLFYALLKPEKF